MNISCTLCINVQQFKNVMLVAYPYQQNMNPAFVLCVQVCGVGFSVNNQII